MDWFIGKKTNQTSGAFSSAFSSSKPAGKTLQAPPEGRGQEGSAVGYELWGIRRVRHLSSEHFRNERDTIKELVWTKDGIQAT